jgi:hypothetical protein
MMNEMKAVCPVVIFLFLIMGSFQKKETQHGLKYSTVKIIFNNVVKNNPIVLYDSTYNNPFGEKYTINKFRYYISNISLRNGSKEFLQKNRSYLIDEKNLQSLNISFSVPPGNYSSVAFLLGVDSLHNVSGAQDGALDPTNDMFWTWNTGYVMAKLEGNSPSSALVNNKYEFHIGGFSGKYNVLKNISLNFQGEVNFASGKTIEIHINADVDDWWQNPNEIRISEMAAVNAPGKLALKLSDNYAKMFHLKKIITE